MNNYRETIKYVVITNRQVSGFDTILHYWRVHITLWAPFRFIYFATFVVKLNDFK